MINFYDLENNNDIVDFSTIRTPNFGEVLNYDSTPRTTKE